MRPLLLGLLISGWLLALPTAARPEIPPQGELIEISLADFRFTPSKITLEQGRPYVLHFTNTSNHSHDFTAKAFFQAAQVSAQDLPLVSGGRVRLDGRESADVHLVAPTVGEYDAHCSHFLHAAFGMKGRITVRPAR
jgi:uncharacterized cupredoxin-like copper-binding protein